MKYEEKNEKTREKKINGMNEINENRYKERMRIAEMLRGPSECVLVP
jgi:hypothetical protein